ncbi:MAG: TauD/TfdA family dioxygenase [Sneathiella sp.]
MLEVTKTGQACGAVVKNVDLSKNLSQDLVAELRSHWLDHHVLAFPDQKLDHDALVRVATSFGPIGDDPFINPIDDHDQIAAIHRKADETGKLFADNWHSDWSFQTVPPAATCLYGIKIPPTGGDTLFSNQHMALEAMPADMRAKYDGKTALHSAHEAYANDGVYSDQNFSGAMNIQTSSEASKTQTHPLIRPHPESGKIGLMGGGYVLDLADTDRKETLSLLRNLYQWQGREEFVYRHKWESNMLVIWDNRSVLHQATGGYEGHERLLHRLTIADDPDYYARR